MFPTNNHDADVASRHRLVTRHSRGLSAIEHASVVMAESEVRSQGRVDVVSGDGDVKIAQSVCCSESRGGYN